MLWIILFTDFLIETNTSVRFRFSRNVKNASIENKAQFHITEHINWTY